MTTSLKRRHRDRVVRRGIGMIVESDFYRTDAGRKHFGMQLDSIRYCVQETANFDALYAYLTCGNYDFNCDPRPRTVAPAPVPRLVPRLTSSACAITHRRPHEEPAPAPQHQDRKVPAHVSLGCHW